MRKQGYVYFAAFAPSLIKIGYSVRPVHRVASISRRVPHHSIPECADLASVRLIGVIPGAFEREREIHSTFRSSRVTGCREWFLDSTEIRESIDRLLAESPTEVPALEDASTINVAVPKSLHVKLTRIADRTGSKLKFMVARAIKEFVERELKA